MPHDAKRIVVSSIKKVPEAETLIADLMRVIQSDVVQYTAKTRQGKVLGLSEARVVQGYVKALTELSREQRERAKSENASDMSNEQLAEALLLSMQPDELERTLQLVEAKKAASKAPAPLVPSIAPSTDDSDDDEN